MAPICMSIRDASAASGIGRSTLYVKIADGAIEARKVGRKTLVLSDSLFGFINGLPPANIGSSRKLSK